MQSWDGDKEEGRVAGDRVEHFLSGARLSALSGLSHFISYQRTAAGKAQLLPHCTGEEWAGRGVTTHPGHSLWVCYIVLFR